MKILKLYVAALASSMLNLRTIMFKPFVILSLFFFAQTTDISIISPQTGQTLREKTDIVGKMNVANFASAELAFSYASNPANSWFAIQTFSQPATDKTLAVWDTTALTDGDYILHLRVFFQDGSSQDVVVSDLKIRNDEKLPADTPVSTMTPVATDNFHSLDSPPLPALTFEPAPTLPIFPSPAPLPTNPASVTPSSIYSTFARGVLIALALFALFFLVFRLRKN